MIVAPTDAEMHTPETPDAAEHLENDSAPEDSSTGTSGDASQQSNGDNDSASVESENNTTHRTWRERMSWVLVFSALPLMSLVLAAGAGYLRWQESSSHSTQQAEVEVMQAARDTTVAMLNYRPESVDKDLSAAQQRLTGSFKDAYASLVHDVVIPGAKQKAITAVANVVAEATVNASWRHAVVLVFVDQTITMGSDAPTDTASSVRVTLANVNGSWLVSGFDPV